MVKYIFKFYLVLVLGCIVGVCIIMVVLGVIQEVVESEIFVLGYIVMYVVGNIFLIIWGVVIVLFMQKQIFNIN